MAAAVLIVVNFMLPSNLTQPQSCVLSNINFMSFKNIHFGRRPLQQDIHIFKYPCRTNLTCWLPKGCFIVLISLVILTNHYTCSVNTWAGAHSCWALASQLLIIVSMGNSIRKPSKTFSFIPVKTLIHVNYFRLIWSIIDQSCNIEQYLTVMNVMQ